VVVCESRGGGREEGGAQAGSVCVTFSISFLSYLTPCRDTDIKIFWTSKREQQKVK
jgi:hypothetical protein